MANEPYRVRIGLHNITSGPEATPVYNPVVELNPVSGANFIFQPREDLEQGAAEIAAGDTFWTDYFVLIPQFSGQVNVAGSFVFLDGSEEDPVPPAVIVSHPRQAALAITGTPRDRRRELTWAAVPGATNYQVFATPSPSTAFGGTPTATTAAGTTTATVPASPGVATYYAVSATVGGKAVMRHALVASPRWQSRRCRVRRRSFDATAGNGQATVSWTAPASDGGSADHGVRGDAVRRVLRRVRPDVQRRRRPPRPSPG